MATPRVDAEGSFLTAFEAGKTLLVEIRTEEKLAE